VKRLSGLENGADYRGHRCPCLPDIQQFDKKRDLKIHNIAVVY
jgi:hypothetical protein